MTAGAYLDAILDCLGGGMSNADKVAWLTYKRQTSPGVYEARIDLLLAGAGVYVLAEAARHVDGMVAT